MTQLILQGGNLSESTADSSGALDAAWTVKQAITHVHFPWANGVRADGTIVWTPMIHPTAPTTAYYPIPIADTLAKRGQLLMVSWGARNLKGPAGTPVAFKSADIVAGKYDTYLHQCAKSLAAFKRPVIFALNPEFNWSGGLNYMPGPDFVAFWRYVVNLFRTDGATNVTWSWHANQLGKAGNGQTTAEDRLPEFFPGVDWVDMVGFDVYNLAAARNSTWATFDQILTGAGTTWLGNTYGAVTRLAPGKQVVIGEFGCHTAPGDKAAWIRDALASIPTKYPDIAIISYYGLNDGASHWSLDTTDGTVQAWADGILRGPYARGGEFTMPADLQPLGTSRLNAPLTWGDELGRLGAQVASLNQQVATLGRQLATSSDLLATLQQQRDDAVQRALDAQARADAAQAEVAEVTSAVRVLTRYSTAEAA